MNVRKLSMLISGVSCMAGLMACQSPEKSSGTSAEHQDLEVDQFADLEVLRYHVPGWEELSLKQKTLAYYLYQAALSGRDIIYDQRGKYNLTIRKTLEAIFNSPGTAQSGADWEQLKTYAGRFWFSNGNHHHYSNDKFVPECSFEYFADLVKACDEETLPLQEGETVDAFLSRMKQVIFDPTFEAKMV